MLPRIWEHEHTRPLQERFLILLAESGAPAGAFYLWFMLHIAKHILLILLTVIPVVISSDRISI